MVERDKMEKAVKRYNSIMNSMGLEHNTIGTRYSESTENWNLRDMVAECDYTLSTYYEDGHANANTREQDYKMWKSETTKLRNFIRDYKSYIKDMRCTVGHCSDYD